jgi:hypothetical protein
MNVQVTQHRKAPNKAVELVLASANLAAEPIISAGWTEESCSKLVEAIKTVWADEAKLRRCKVDNLRVQSNDGYFRKQNEPYFIWLTWGYRNGGNTFATITLTPS